MMPTIMQSAALVVFGDALPALSGYDLVIAQEKHRAQVEAAGAVWKDLDALISPGSIYEAKELLDTLPAQRLADGTLVSKSFVYKGYELWWMHYDSLYHHFCLPFTQFQPLLERAREFARADIAGSGHVNLFRCYLEAHGTEVREIGRPVQRALPFGVMLQMLLTLLSLPALMLRRAPILVYAGDKFERGKDYDFRQRYVYEELRRRRLPFVECIRGIQPWRVVLEHAWIRRRAVMYADTAFFLGRFMSIVTFARARARRHWGTLAFAPAANPNESFRQHLSGQYLLGAYEDIFAIRIQRFLLSLIGVRAAYFAGVSERNMPTLIACKLLRIPTVGIMHGVQSRIYNVNDYLTGFRGAKRLGVDAYGVWSGWWKSYYERWSRAYGPDELAVSGPMRPLTIPSVTPPRTDGPVRVLFVSEEAAVPEEVLPYLTELLAHDDLSVTLKFRPTRDGFEEWISKHEPALLSHPKLGISRAPMQEAFADAEVAVGTQSTGVLEALQQLRVPVYFRTRKWGDYYELKEEGGRFFAETPAELVEKVRAARSTPAALLEALLERFFGDPRKNGSAWVVAELQKLI